ncbi:potassium channel family protein [Halosimplex rubrum]|uniref:Potassium channel family protein n=1 Tax=Halosimplex rubrum TaxID=869889 RepID=A0A7D5PC80_9EURY|nr:potassium channel family protein [Halosimplex rubrum]QLH79099.1 potassium channel family protein [Halosimplex rubrum]
MSSQSARVPDGARERVRFYLLDHRTPLGKAIDIGLLALNLVFIAVFVAQTYSLEPATRARLWDLEVAIAGVFTMEYVLRIYGARDRLSEFLNPYTVVDLLSVLPTVLVILYPVPAVALNAGFLRVLRVVRVLRFYRFTRDEEFFFGSVSGGALRATKLLLTVLVVLFVSAGLFYAAETRANPGVEHFGDAFYYVVITLSTVGFGDIVPVTRPGRWVTVISVLAAIILIPWQASKIVRAWTSDDKVPTTCHDCGLTGHDPDASHCKACGHVVYQEYESDER